MRLKASRAGLAAVAALAVWLAAWVWFTRLHFIDDALIYARYAENLFRHHLITFDGVEKSSGISSLLFLGLVTALHRWVPAIAATKALSTLFFFALFILLAYFYAKTGKKRYLVLALVYSSPMAVRWLADGLDTSLALFLTACTAAAAFRAAFAAGRPRGLPGGAAAFLLVFARVELLLAATCAAAGIFACRRILGGRDGWVRAAPFAAGGALAAAAVFLIQGGSLLPDSAIAKTGAGSFFNFSILRSFVSALSLGAGSLAVWVYSVSRVWRGLSGERKLRIAQLFVNALLPVFFLMVSWRGQYVQGVRYFLWCPLLLTIWNFHVSELYPAPAAGGGTRRRLSVVVLAALLLAAGWGLEAAVAVRSIDGRIRCFRQMRGDGLEALEDEKGAAYDIGYIGYFTRARMMDLSGLVGGREFARLSGWQRLEAMRDLNPAFLYLEEFQIPLVAGHLDLASWVVWKEYPYANAGRTFRYYLLVRAETARARGLEGTRPILPRK